MNQMELLTYHWPVCRPHSMADSSDIITACNQCCHATLQTHSCRRAAAGVMSQTLSLYNMPNVSGGSSLKWCYMRRRRWLQQITSLHRYDDGATYLG